MFSVEGIGWVILLWSDDVRLGIGRGLPSPSRVTGRSDRLSDVRGRTNEGWLRSDGGISGASRLGDMKKLPWRQWGHETTCCCCYGEGLSTAGRVVGVGSGDGMG